MITDDSEVIKVYAISKWEGREKKRNGVVGVKTVCNFFSRIWEVLKD